MHQSGFITHVMKGLLYFLFLMVLPFWIIIPYVITILTVTWKLPVYDALLLDVVGIVFILLGICLSLYSVYIFALRGKGTPAPIAPTSRLTQDGLYRYTRNPMYVGYACYYFGLFLFQGSILLFVYWIGVVITINLFLIFYEEPQLEKKFGDEYKKYTKKVPRWFRIPL